MPASAPLETEWRTDLFDSVVTLSAAAKRLVPGDEEGALYSTLRPAPKRPP